MGNGFRGWLCSQGRASTTWRVLVLAMVYETRPSPLLILYIAYAGDGARNWDERCAICFGLSGLGYDDLTAVAVLRLV